MYNVGQKSSKPRDLEDEPTPSPRKSPKRGKTKSESTSFMDQGTSKGDSSNLPKNKLIIVMSPSTENLRCICTKG